MTQVLPQYPYKKKGFFASKYVLGNAAKKKKIPRVTKTNLTDHLESNSKGSEPKPELVFLFFLLYRIRLLNTYYIILHLLTEYNLIEIIGN